MSSKTDTLFTCGRRVTGCMLDLVLQSVSEASAQKQVLISLVNFSWPLAVPSHCIQVLKELRPWSLVEQLYTRRPKTPGRKRQLPELSNPPSQGWSVGRRRPRASRGQDQRRTGDKVTRLSLLTSCEPTTTKGMPKLLNDKSQGLSVVVCLKLAGTAE